MIGYGIWFIMLGMLATSTLIVSRIPALKDYIANISAYQGWLAIVSAALGLFTVLPDAIRGLPSLTGIILLVAAFVMIVLGMLLGLSAVRPFIKNEQFLAKIDGLVSKISPYQTLLGLVSIGLGVAGIVVYVLARIAIKAGV